MLSSLEQKKKRKGKNEGQEVLSVPSAQVCFSLSNCRTFFFFLSCRSRTVNPGRAAAFAAGVLRVGASPWKRCLRTSGGGFQLWEETSSLRQKKTRLTVLTRGHSIDRETRRGREREREIRSDGELTGASEGLVPRLSSGLLNPHEGVGSVSELVFEEGGWGWGWGAAPGHYNTSAPSFFHTVSFLFRPLLFPRLTQVKQLDRNQDQGPESLLS